jgi:hypothetical protein
MLFEKCRLNDHSIQIRTFYQKYDALVSQTVAMKMRFIDLAAVTFSTHENMAAARPPNVATKARKVDTTTERRVERIAKG